MDNQPWLWLLLATSLVVVPSSSARAQRSQLERGYAPPPGQSHHDLPGGPDGNNAEEMIAQRFAELKQLHQLQDQVQELLKDQNFVNNIRQQIGDKQLGELQEKIRRGDDLRGDGAWNKLLRQATSGHKLDQQQINMLRGLLERSGGNPPSGSGHPSLRDDRKLSKLPPVSPDPVPSEDPSVLPAQPAEKSFWDRMQEGGEEWLSEHMEELSDDVIRALTGTGADGEGAPLTELLRDMKKQSDLSADDLAESATGLSQYFPKVGTFLNEQRGAWDEVRSLFHEVPKPSLTGLGSGPGPSSLPAASAADAESWGTASFMLLTLGVFLLLVWKTGGWPRSKTAAGKDEDWRLGSWPVAPGAVTTRQELIHAFEYVALLCLGRRASTCNHRTLASRLAETDAVNPARRQAAELLAGMYEQARYAPAGEVLSPEELSDARQALCYLAGVTAA